MITAQYKHLPFARGDGEVRHFPAGATMAEIVRAFDKAPEFERFGAAYILDPRKQQQCVDHLERAGVTDLRSLRRNMLGLPQADEIYRQHWERLRPRDGTVVFLSIRPQFEGDSGKVFSIVATVALLTLAMVASAGVTSLFAPGLVGKVVGGLVGGAILVGGSSGLALLNKPTAGAPVQPVGGGAGPTLGQAGIGQNALGAYAVIPAVLGFMRHSPPLLSRPFTFVEDNDEWGCGIYGHIGPTSLEDIKINNGIAITDLPTGSYRIETREGFDDDAPLTLITKSVFQENVDQPFATHRLESDQATLVNPFAESYPKPTLLRTVARCNDFRIALAWPGGIFHNTVTGGALVPFRIRIRRVNTSTWIKLPEIQVKLAIHAFARQEIWIRWGNNSVDSEVRQELQNQTTPWIRAYLKNPAWQANSYFGNPGGAEVVNIAPSHVFRGKDKIVFHLHTNTFPVDQYDVEITRGAAAPGVTAQLQPPSYIDLFTWTGPSAAAVKKIIPAQDAISAQTYISNYASFRNEYPIKGKNLALIAARFKNIKASSLSVLAKSYVDGVKTNDPGALLKYVWTGPLNPRPIPESIVDDLSDLTAHCAAKGLTCNALISQGSVEQVAQMIAACGDAAIKRSQTWGVIIDKDTSADGVAAMFTPHQMTEPFTYTITFPNSARVLLPTFNDEDKDYVSRETAAAVYDDGVTISANLIAEGVNFPGITSEENVRRAALIRLRRIRLRNIFYRCAVNLESLGLRNGDLVAVGHDILKNSYGTGRVVSWTHDGGSPANLLSITLDSEIIDAPSGAASGLFGVSGVFTLGKFFDLSGARVGLRVRLADNSFAVIPVVAAEGATLTVDGDYPLPSRLEVGCVAAVGPRDRETRRLKIISITPAADFHARLEMVDEAPGIFAGF